MSAASIMNLMRELDLRGALSAFERLVSSPQELDAMPMQLLLETYCRMKSTDRLTRKQHSLLRMSHLPYVISPSDIAYDSVRGEEFKAKLLSLMTLDFIRLGQNLTVFGSAGTGKVLLRSCWDDLHACRDIRLCIIHLQSLSTTCSYLTAHLTISPSLELLPSNPC